MSNELLLNGIQALIILLASAIALYQLRISAKSNRSEAYSRIGDKLHVINEFIFNNLPIYNCLLLEPDEINKLIDEPGNDQLEDKLIIMLDIMLTYYREIFNQYSRFGLINKSQWEAWKIIIKRFINKPYVRHYWKTNNWKFTKEFKEQVEQIMI